MKRLAILLGLLVSCNSPQVIVEDTIEEVSLTERYQIVKTIEDAVNATVQVDFGLATGTGFVVGHKIDPVTKSYYYEILSAAHVFEEDIPVDGSPVPPVRVIFSINKKKSFSLGTLEKIDIEADIALIKVYDFISDKPRCPIFEIEKGTEYLNYHTDVAIVGYPQGIGPIVTRGHISGIEMLEWDKESFLTTAQSAPGTSGGPVINLKTGRIIGMLRAVLVLRPSGQLLTWCSIVTPVSRIQRFLGEYYVEDYPYIIKPAEVSRGVSFQEKGNFLLFYPDE